MADRPWKRAERQAAAALGGVRSGPTGRNSPDVSGVELSPEVKYQKRYALRAADLAQARANALPGKPWCLILKQHRTRGALVIMELDTFKDIYGRAYPSKENQLG